MARKRSTVNYDDVTIMYGSAIICGMKYETVCPELSIRDSELRPERKTIYCISPHGIAASLSEKAKRFLERLAKALRVRSVHKRCRSTVLCIPAPAEDIKERQIQTMNYGNFIRTMAEMFKKYAPQLLN